MNRIIKFAARHPWGILGLLALVSLLFALQLGNLRILVSAESMLEKGTAAWDYFVKTEETFGTEDTAIVVLRDPDIFDPNKLSRIRSTLRDIEALPQVTRSSSLFDAKNLKNVDDTIYVKPYLEALPVDEAEVAQVIADATHNPLVLGNLISADGQTLAINLHYRADPADPNFDKQLTSAIEQHIAPLRQHVQTVYQVGSSILRSDLTDKIRADQRMFLPLSVLVLLMTLAFALRRFNAALMPLITASISVLWTLGFMAWLGIPVNIMTSIVPALVIIIGSTEDIHLLTEYAAGIDDRLERPAAIRRMADNMGVAVLFTFITTYLGFLSIALNDIQLLYEFGLVASTGLLFNFVITVALVPVMLRWLGHRRARSIENGPRDTGFQRFATILLILAQKRRLTVLVMAGILAVGAILASTQVRINNNLMDYLDPQSDLYRNVERIHDELSGVNSFSIVVDAGIDNTFLQVKYLEELLKIQAHLEQMEHFDRSFSFANFVALVNSVMDDMAEGELLLPEADDMVREYMLFIKQQDVSAFVSPRFDRARILVRHNINSSDWLNEAVADLDKRIASNLDPGLRVEITGKSILSNKAVEEMARSQLQSLLLVGGVILVLVSMLFVSLRAGLIALLPNLFPVAMLFAVMALAGIPLNAGTSMVAAIALGICVDDTMHVMSRFHEELKRHEDRQGALVAMIQAEAVPIFATSVALAAGFAIFATSSFEPLVHFGLLSAMVILIALAATFVLTPLLLGSSELLTVWDLLSYKVQREALQRSALFQGMYIWQIKKLLLSSELRHFGPGEPVVREGEPGKEMFVVLNGRVEAQRNREEMPCQHLRTFHVGELFGEVGPLSEGKRTADVVSLAETELLVLSWDRIDRLTRLHPILAFRLFRNLTRIIGARLTQTTEYRMES